MSGWRKLLELVGKVRSQKRPSWALPTCAQCGISMREAKTQEGRPIFLCPKCGLTHIPGAGEGKPLLNEGDHHGEI